MSVHAGLNHLVCLRLPGARRLLAAALILAAGGGGPVCLRAGPTPNPEYCAPGTNPDPAQAARRAAALQR